jgi:hypothetical protein
MERHWHQQIRRHRLGFQVLAQKLPQRGGQRLEVPILKLMNCFAHQALEGERRPDTIDVQLPLPAVRTAISLSQRFAARWANESWQSRQSGLARCANKGTLASTAYASGWKEEIDELALDFVQSGYEHASSIDQDRLANPGVVHRAANNRLVDVDVTVSYLEVEATIGISADPRLIVNWRALAAEVRQRHQVACIALLALGQTELLHKTTSHV